MIRASTAPTYLLISHYALVKSYEGVLCPEKTRAAVINEIIAGEHDHIVQVIEMHEGRYRDISADIAADIWSATNDPSDAACAFMRRYGVDPHDDGEGGCDDHRLSAAQLGIKRFA